MFQFKVDSISDKGPYRADNEDHYIIKMGSVEGEPTGLFAVADGVGGLDKGEVASELAIDCLDRWWNEVYPTVYNGNPAQSLEKAIEEADALMKEYGDKHGIRFATTLSAILIHKGKYHIRHIGDTKIIEMKADRKVKELSFPHLKQKVPGGKYYLTQCLGNAKKSFKQYKAMGKVEEWNRYFIGSDGAFNLEEKEGLADFIGCQSVSKSLVENARKKGETDNITLIYLELTGEGGDPYEEARKAEYEYEKQQELEENIGINSDAFDML